MNDHFVQRGGWWVAGQFVLMIAVAILGIVCGGESKPGFLFLGGLVLLATSAICCIGGTIALGRNLTPFPKPSVGAKLVRHGIYGMIRHPLYTAMVCAALGWSAIRSSWPAFAVALALAVFLDAKARREEAWLRQKFSDYTNYEQRVRRFIPWVY